MEKRKRIVFLKEYYNDFILNAIREKRLLTQNPNPLRNPTFNDYFEPAFFNFKTLGGIYNLETLFQFFLDSDPTSNKEYLQWILNQYKQILKLRKNDVLLNAQCNQRGGFVYSFFEDMYKLKDSLEIFNRVKKTKAFNGIKRDINYFSDFRDLIEEMIPYSFVNEEEFSNYNGSLDNVISLGNTLTPMQIKLIDDNVVKLLYHDEDWIIVETPTQEGNVEFGRNTQWCTAGTRYNNMFTNYRKDGWLFILIKRGYGKYEDFKNAPEKRLQFHFESNSFMDARDRAIKLNEFFNNYPKVKKYFGGYIINEFLPKKQKDEQNFDILEFFKKYGYYEKLIDVLKEINPIAFTLVKNKVPKEIISRIGEIKSIKKLVLENIDLDEIPFSVSEMFNLEYLSLRNNKMLKTIPKWINELTNLKTLHLGYCDIQNFEYIGGLVNLNSLYLDVNPRLKKLPDGFENLKKLKLFTANSCDLREIPDEFVGLDELTILITTDNHNLKKVPFDLVKNKKILVIGLDNTSVSNEQVNKMSKVNSKIRLCISRLI